MNAAILDEVSATLARLRVLHPELQKDLDKSPGYAVFPSVGRASAVLGVTFGRGILFEQGKPIGNTTVTAFTLGVQVGGQTFSEIVMFHDEAALEQIKKGKYAATANASAVLVKAAASGTTNFGGVTAKAYSRGGMLLEASLGIQKINFHPDEELEQHAEVDADESETEADEGVEDEVEEEERGEEESAEGKERGNGASAKEGNGSEQERRSERRGKEGHRGGRLMRLIPGRIKKSAMGQKVTRTYEALRKEKSFVQLLHPDSKAALARLLEKDPSLREKLDEAYAYAIFPSVGKASAVIGTSYGRGEVFKDERLVGHAAIVQLTIGVQVGGQTFTELVLIEDEDAFKALQRGKVAFAANATAVIVKAGAAATRRFSSGTAVYVHSQGGLLLEAVLGGQKIIYRPASPIARRKKLEIPAAEAS